MRRRPRTPVCRARLGGFDERARAVLRRIEEFLPFYSGVHRARGTSLSSRPMHTRAHVPQYFRSRDAKVATTSRSSAEIRPKPSTTSPTDYTCASTTSWSRPLSNTTPIFCRSRVASRRFVECGPDGTFTTADVVAELDRTPRARLLTITGASNITGWMPPIEEIVDAAHSREIPVAVDCAQLAPHRPLPESADFVVWSGHKMYAPFGAGVLIGPAPPSRRVTPSWQAAAR